MYFGLRFLCTELSLSEFDRELPNILTMSMLKKVSKQQGTGEVFIKEIKNDVEKLNLSRMGSKSDWRNDGFFILLRNVTVYVYCHPSHAFCLKVGFSQIEKSLEFNISEPELKLLEKERMSNTCEHSNHYRLEPFFMDNQRLMELYSMDETEDEAKTVLDEVRVFGRSENAGQESEFQCPMTRSHCWSENDWTKRLYVGIKKTFTTLDVTYGPGLGVGQFHVLLQKLRVGSVDERCFIFRGYPDIIIHNKSLICSSGSASTSTSTSADASDTSGEESLLENSWQRPPLSGYHGNAPPEKLGEVISGLYILLVSKILRKVLKNKSTNRVFQVKGVLLDKAATAIVVCCLSVKFTPTGGSIDLKEVDYSGRYFDSSSLCLLIRTVCTKI